MAAEDIRAEANADAVRRRLEDAADGALMAIGEMVERYAGEALDAPGGAGAGSVGRTIRESLTHEARDGQLTVGSALEVAAYVELGTGPLYEPPPEWLENRAPGGRGRAGLAWWLYFDEDVGRVKVGKPQPARPFLRPAILEHIDEIRQTLRQALEEA